MSEKKLNKKSELILTCNNDLVFRKEDEGAFLFNTLDGSLKCLNFSGAFVWELIETKKATTLGKILLEFKKKFLIEIPGELEKDVVQFLDEMISRKYLEKK